MSKSPARSAALAALKRIRDGAYANLAVKEVLGHAGLSQADAGFVTDLVFGVCRTMGTLDLVIEEASGRRLTTLQPGVIDILRLGTYQLLLMRVPAHACVSTSVWLAEEQIGRRVTGVVNAILRRVADLDWDEWMDRLTQGVDERDNLAIRTCHPRWIVDVYARCLPDSELEAALAANNDPPVPTLVARPGLCTREELLCHGGTPTRFSPWGVDRSSDPADVPAVREGRAGVQDEGSQLVTEVLADADAPEGVWLDMCAGPGGKAALLTGLALQRGEHLVASEVYPHRALLVAQAERGYGSSPVMVADARQPAWRPSSFSRIMLDASCSGLGALRRRPEARWRKTDEDIAGLTSLQRGLLRSACTSLVPGGVLAYVTCSPHPEETIEVLHDLQPGFEILNAPAFLPQVPSAESGLDPRFIQLWPHRHGTDAMFCALVRKSLR